MGKWIEEKNGNEIVYVLVDSNDKPLAYISDSLEIVEGYIFYFDRTIFCQTVEEAKKQIEQFLESQKSQILEEEIQLPELTYTDAPVYWIDKIRAFLFNILFVKKN